MLQLKPIVLNFSATTYFFVENFEILSFSHIHYTNYHKIKYKTTLTRFRRGLQQYLVKILLSKKEYVYSSNIVFRYIKLYGQ